jgi:TetR/AcrR family transcriptional regulator, fatty acid metabolism regulator protein
MEGFTSRQVEIINASLKIMGRKGLPALTTKNLAKALRVTEPAIYRHFESKTDILLGILTYLETNARRNFAKAMESNAPSIDKMESVYLRFFKGLEKAPALTTAIFSQEQFQDDKRLAAKILAIIRETRQAIIQIIERGVQRKEIRQDIPKEQMALIIMGSMRFLVTTWRIENMAFDLSARGKQTWDSLRILLEEYQEKPRVRLIKKEGIDGI